MLRTKLIPATTAAVIALGAAGVAYADSGENGNSKEISAVLEAKTSISQAIAAAESETGGRAMKVNVERKEGAYVYEVKTVTKDKVSEVTVDPASGKVTGTEGESLIAKVFDGEDQDEFAKLAASPVTLTTAVATAEHETGGKAIEARFENDDGKLRFEVETAKDKAVHKVRIDAASGKIVNVSTAEGGENDED